MTLKSPDNMKLLRSAAISGIAVCCVLLLKTLFPSFDFVQAETAMLMAITAWLVNTVKESAK